MGKGFEKFSEEAEEVMAVVKKNKPENEKYVRNVLDKIIGHIFEVCDDEYDAKMAQEWKSFVNGWKYMYGKARQYAVQNVAVIDDDVAYGWFDEYVGLDDKPKPKEAAKTRKTDSAPKETKQEEPEEADDEETAEDAEAEESSEEAEEQTEQKPAEPKPMDEAREKELKEQLSFFGLL